MNIANMLGTSTSSALEALYGQQKKKDDDDSAQSGVYSWQQDRVSISDAALALAGLAGKEQAPSEDGASQDSLNGQGSRRVSLPNAKTDGTEEAADSVESAGGGQQGFSLGGGSSASDIEAKIKALQQKIVETQNSDLPEDAKSAMISGLQSQIGQLAQEKSALESQSSKG